MMPRQQPERRPSGTTHGKRERLSGSISRKRLLFVTGKGGVGKTTVAAALSAFLAAEGKRVLLLEIGRVSSLCRIFRLESVGYDAVAVGERLELARITPAECLREYGLMKLRIKRLFNIVFENPLVKSLINMLPGMEEMLLIGKIGHLVHLGERASGSRNLYDVVVVDAPPTGQGAGLLALPSTLLNTIKRGPVAREMTRLRELLTDSQATGVVLVTLPEELPVDEALEMYHEVQENGLRVCAIVANRTIPSVANRQDREVLTTFVQARRAGRDLSGPYSLASSALGLLTLKEQQDAQLQRLARKCDTTLVQLPLLDAEVIGDDELQTLAAELIAVAGHDN